MSLLAALQNRLTAFVEKSSDTALVRGVDWHDDSIADAWFGSHFHYAADVVHNALLGYCDPASSTILDFGCYDGITSLGLALRYRWHAVIGVDIDPGFKVLPRLARQEIGLRRMPRNARYQAIHPGQSLSAFSGVDAVMSWSVFEHVDRPILDQIVGDFHSILRPGGICFVQIDPLYYSPQGSHLGRFAVEPWAHLLMNQNQLQEHVMSAHAETVPADEITEQFRSMSFAKYKQFIFRHYLELNRITADELVALFLRHGFKLEHEIRRKTELPVPVELLSRYDEEELATHEIVAVFRAASG